MEDDPFAVIEGDDDRRFATGASLGTSTSAASIRKRDDASAQPSKRPAAPATSGTTSSAPAGRSRSRFVAAQAPTSRARKPRCSNRSRAIAPSRATSRRSPSTHGLLGKPTVVNNVETLVNVPLILRDGGPAFAAIGTEGSAGPKLFCVSGNVARPGLYEVAVRHDARASCSSSPAACRERPRRSRPSSSAARPAPLSAPTRSTSRSRSRARGRPAQRSARASSSSSTTPRTSSTRSCGSRSSSATSRAASASPAVSGPCARRSCCTASPPAGRTARATRSSRLLGEIGQAMRDASICGLGQTASSAIEIGLRAPGLVAL